MEDKFNERHSRTIQLIGKQAFGRLQKAHVMIVGLGGVGGYAAEQLVRAGVGSFTIVDADKVSESNINRQLISDYESVGKMKADLFARRMKNISPDVQVDIREVFIHDAEISELFNGHRPDYVIDAIDTLMPKVNFLSYCLEKQIPVVSALGAGGKTDPAMVRIADISKTYNDGLARMLRKRLHKRRIYEGFQAVFSPEDISPHAIMHEPGKNKKTNVGTVSYMPAIFGIYCASEVIRCLIKVKD
jgi:tRNA A37 threonylcarbamoyladenosine dehydratase